MPCSAKARRPFSIRSVTPTPFRSTPWALGITSSVRTVTLYLEAVEASAGIAAERVLVSVAPNGPGQPDFFAGDAARATAVKVKLRDTADGNKAIIGGSVAWITPEPVMPQLEVSLVPNLAATVAEPAKWLLQSDFTKLSKGAPVRQHLISIPQVPQGGPAVTRDLAVDASWSIAGEYAALPADQSFFGGDVSLTVSVGQALRQSVRFFIRGRNPDEATAKATIQSRPGTPWYAYAMAKHESQSGARGRFYNQFNELGTSDLSIEGTPNWGPPDGWGIFQTDSAGGQNNVQSIHLWNWRENVTLGTAIAINARTWAGGFMRGQRNTANQDSGRVQPVPDEVVDQRCTFSDAAPPAVEDAVSMKAFNTDRRRPYVRWNSPARLWVFDRINHWRNLSWNYVALTCARVE